MKEIPKDIPWKNVKPDGLTNAKGEEWTGEVDYDCGKLWFLYKSADGNRYESTEEPALRIKMDKAVFYQGAICPRSIAP